MLITFLSLLSQSFERSDGQNLSYSPDLAPCDFCLFPKLKLNGCFFNDISTIETATTRELEVIPQNKLEHAFESLLNRCNKCIETGREYFE